MEISVYQGMDKERLNEILEMPHEEGLTRYIVVPQNDFSNVMVTFEPFHSLKVHIDSYIQYRTQDCDGVNIGLLADISILKVVYSESKQTPVQIVSELSTGFYGLINEYSLVELIFNEVTANEGLNEWLEALFVQVDGLEAEYNEYKFFLNNLHND